MLLCDSFLQNLHTPVNIVGLQQQAEHDSGVCLISQYVNSTVQLQHGPAALEFCHEQTSSASGREAQLADFEGAGQVCMPAGLLFMPYAAASAADVAIAAVATTDQVPPATAACTEGAASDACTETVEGATHPPEVLVIAAAADELGASVSAPDTAGTAAAPTDELTADPAATAAALAAPESEQDQDLTAAPELEQEQEQAAAPEPKQDQAAAPELEQEQAAAREREQEQAAARDSQQEQAAARESQQEQAAALHQAVTNAGAVALYESSAASVDAKPGKDSTVLLSSVELMYSNIAPEEYSDSDAAAEEPTDAFVAEAGSVSLSILSAGTGMHDELCAAELTASLAASAAVVNGVAERPAPVPVADAHASYANSSGIMQLFAALQTMVAPSKPTAAAVSASPSTCEHQSLWLAPQPAALQGGVVEQHQQHLEEQQLQQLLAAGAADAGELQGQQLQQQPPARPPWRQQQQDGLCATGAELGMPGGGYLSPQLIATAYRRLGEVGLHGC